MVEEGMNYDLITALCAVLMLALMAVAVFIWKGKVDQQLRALKRIGEMMKKSGMDMDPDQFQGYDQQMGYQQPYAEPQYEQPAAPAAPAAPEAPQAQPEFQQPMQQAQEFVQPEMAQPQVQPEPEIAFAEPQQPAMPVQEQPVQEQPVHEGFAPDDPMFKFQQQTQEFVEENHIMPQAPEAMPQAPQFEQPAAPQAPEFTQPEFTQAPEFPQAPQFEQPVAPQQFAQQAQPAAPQAPQFQQPQNSNVVVSDIAGMGAPQQAGAQMQQNMQERVHMQTQQAMAEKYNMAKSGKVYDKSEIESIIKD